MQINGSPTKYPLIRYAATLSLFEFSTEDFIGSLSIFCPNEVTDNPSIIHH